MVSLAYQIHELACQRLPIPVLDDLPCWILSIDAAQGSSYKWATEFLGSSCGLLGIGFVHAGQGEIKSPSYKRRSISLVNAHIISLHSYIASVAQRSKSGRIASIGSIHRG